MNIEEKILGGILIEPSIMDEEGVADFLEEKWFNHPYDTIFKLISSVYEQNLPIDTVSIFEESQKKGYNISPAFITEMTSKVFSGANVPYHAKVLYEQYLRRESLRTFEEDQKKVVDGKDIFDVIDLHTQKMMDLTTTKTDNGYIGDNYEWSICRVLFQDTVKGKMWTEFILDEVPKDLMY